jgi:hypothetical protein
MRRLFNLELVGFLFSFPETLEVQNGGWWDFYMEEKDDACVSREGLGLNLRPIQDRLRLE